MNQHSQPEQQSRDSVRLKNTSASALGMSLMGVVLLLSGVVMFTLTTIDAFNSHEGTHTIICVLIGLAMYRIGKFLLQQVGKVKLPQERRRSVIS